MDAHHTWLVGEIYRSHSQRKKVCHLLEIMPNSKEWQYFFFVWHKRYIRLCKSKPNQGNFDLVVRLFKNEISTNKPLQFLHLDLFEPPQTRSLGGKYYVYVVVHNFSRFTWFMLLTSKDEVFQSFVKKAKRVQRM